MDAVIEVDIIGQIVNSGPANRHSRAEAFTDRLQYWRLRPELLVACHAGLGVRHACICGFGDRCMAILAVNAQAGHVMLMAEGDRLVQW